MTNLWQATASYLIVFFIVTIGLLDHVSEKNYFCANTKEIVN